MYNPFPLLTPGLLKDQLAKGKMFFVRQSFARGAATGSVAGARGAATQRAATPPPANRVFLIRGYGADEKATAEEHMASLTADPAAFLYEATNADHLHKLGIAAQQPAGYQVFYAAKKGVDWRPPPKIQDRIKEYIRLHHPDWRTKRDGDKIQVGLLEEFGQLFIKFSFGDEEETIPFNLIEKY